MEVNIPITSILPAKAKRAVISGSNIELSFDKYTNADTINDENVVLTDESGNVIPKTIEKVSPVDYNGKSVAIMYKIIPTSVINSNNKYIITIKKGVKSYNDVSSENEQKINVSVLDNDDFIIGNVDCRDGLTVDDASILLQKVLNMGYKMPVEEKTNNYMEYADVDVDGKLTAKDVAILLQKTLDEEFLMPVEISTKS